MQQGQPGGIAWLSISDKRRGGSRYLDFGPVQLFCPGNDCQRVGYFDNTSEDPVYLNFQADGTTCRDVFVHYGCRNCGDNVKVYALRIAVTETLTDKGRTYVAKFMKIGEVPRFGEPRPDLVTDVLDDEFAFFDRGYRAETEGLGIGAFAYYRRFVESHKDKIIDKIRAVAVAQNAGSEILATLDRAKATNSFERVVDAIKEAIPAGLRVKGGHNPLTLLHNALSIGVHEDEDAECLERARDIRTVLTALAEKTTQAFRDSKELDEAVGRLLKRGKATP